MNQPLAIQSWCYRHWKTLSSVLEQLTKTGVSAMELCGAHANFADRDGYSDVIQACAAASVQLVAIGVEKLTGRPEQDRPRFEFCKAAGIRHMSMTFPPE